MSTQIEYWGGPKDGTCGSIPEGVTEKKFPEHSMDTNLIIDHVYKLDKDQKGNPIMRYWGVQ